MRTVDETFKTLAASTARETNVRLTMTKDGETLATLGPSAIKSAKVKRSLERTDRAWGCCSASTLDVEMLTASLPDMSDFDQCRIAVEFGLVDADGTTHWCSMGVFNGRASEVEQNGLFCTFTAIDDLYYMSQVSNVTMVEREKWTGSETVFYSTTAAEIIKLICDEHSIAYSSDIPSATFQDWRPSDAGVKTVKERLCELANIMFYNVSMGADGVELSPFGVNAGSFGPSDYLADGCEINGDAGVSYDGFSCKWFSTNGSIIGRYGEHTYISPSTSTNPYAIDNSGFSYKYRDTAGVINFHLYSSFEDDMETIESIATTNTVFPFSSTAFSLSLFGRPYVQCGDEITVTDVNGNASSCIVFNEEHEYNGAIKSTFSYEAGEGGTGYVSDGSYATSDAKVKVDNGSVYIDCDTDVNENAGIFLDEEKLGWVEVAVYSTIVARYNPALRIGYVKMVDYTGQTSASTYYYGSGKYSTTASSITSAIPESYRPTATHSAAAANVSGSTYPGTLWIDSAGRVGFRTVAASGSKYNAEVVWTW